jgi:quinohemoprotein ethanol dehydrogenase
VAWDPVTQAQRWRVTTRGFMAGGVLATAGGLVFQGEVDGSFNAYTDATGERLWRYDAQSPVMAPPITYSVNGRQYVTVLTGLGTAGAFNGPFLERFGLDPRKQARRVLTFALGANTPLPPTQRGKVEIPEDPAYRPDEATEARGFLVYAPRCGICHGANGIAVGVAPDLRASAIVRQADAFRSVVHDGTLVPGGMPIFDELTDAQLSDLRQYLRSRGVQSRQQVQ